MVWCYIFSFAFDFISQGEHALVVLCRRVYGVYVRGRWADVGVVVVGVTDTAVDKGIDCLWLCLSLR